MEQFKSCKINAAEQLSMDLFGTSNELSSHGLPGIIQASVMQER